MPGLTVTSTIFFSSVSLIVDFTEKFNYRHPSHLKIDVDGSEPHIIAGAKGILRNKKCRSVLIEIQRNDPESASIAKSLEGMGFNCRSQRSNWESRVDRTRENEAPTINMIFERT